MNLGEEDARPPYLSVYHKQYVPCLHPFGHMVQYLQWGILRVV
jgi:hypothetical protein